MSALVRPDAVVEFLRVQPTPSREDGIAMTTKDQKKDLRLSDAMWRGLRDLIEHGSPTWSCRGMSEHGGMDGAVKALCRRGLVEYQTLVVTEEGRKVYDARIDAAKQARARTDDARVEVVKQVEAAKQARAQMEEGYADERRARRRVRE